MTQPTSNNSYTLYRKILWGGGVGAFSAMALYRLLPTLFQVTQRHPSIVRSAIALSCPVVGLSVGLLLRDHPDQAQLLKVQTELGAYKLGYHWYILGSPIRKISSLKQLQDGSIREGEYVHLLTGVYVKATSAIMSRGYVWTWGINSQTQIQAGTPLGVRLVKSFTQGEVNNRKPHYSAVEFVTCPAPISDPTNPFACSNAQTQQLLVSQSIPRFFDLINQVKPSLLLRLQAPLQPQTGGTSPCKCLPYDTRYPRDFNTSMTRDNRFVGSFYSFDTWPDQGVCTASELTHLLSQITSNQCTNSGPVLVHCYQGLGRTGTVICAFRACEQLVQMQQTGKDLKEVDVIGHVYYVLNSMNEATCYIDTQAQFQFVVQFVSAYHAELLRIGPNAKDSIGMRALYSTDSGLNLLQILNNAVK